jgi:Cu/Ag efflux protein CusF
MRRFISFIFLVILCFGSGCHAPASEVKRYPLNGEIISVDPAKNLITIKHGDIPGLMPAMTMQYQFADGEPVGMLKPGDHITAVLVVGENVGHLERIEVERIKIAMPIAPSTAPFPPVNPKK